MYTTANHVSNMLKQDITKQAWCHSGPRTMRFAFVIHVHWPCGYLVAVDKRSTTGCRKFRMNNNILKTCQVSMYQKQVHL